MHTAKLNDSEIAERVAVLKRFRSLLEQQRLKFREYLTVLEKQEKSISDENTDAVLQHTELEESIIAEIFTIQKVIDPLEYMYTNICKNEHSDLCQYGTDCSSCRSQFIIDTSRTLCFAFFVLHIPYEYPITAAVSGKRKERACIYTKNRQLHDLPLRYCMDRYYG